MNMENLISNLSCDNYTITENFNNFSLIMNFDRIITLNEHIISNILEIIPSYDKLFTLNIKYDDFDNISYTEIENFIDQQQSTLNDFRDDITSTKITITINKSKTSNIISIYSLGNFYNYLNTNSFEVIIKNILLRYNHNYIIFEIIDTDIDYLSSSNLFVFKGLNSNIDNSQFIVDTSILENFKSSCYFLGDVKILFSPNDFNIDISISTDLNNYFKKLKILFSLIYIFNMSNIKDNTLTLQLNGYKNFECIIPLDQIEYNQLEIYFKIFNWIYDSGNISDKIGIARNIISLYLSTSDSIILDDSIYAAIESNYTIYLKENLKEYLELKTQLINNLFSATSEISELISNLSNNFIKNLESIITFTISLVVLNSLSDKKFSDIFTPDITVLSFGLIVISCVYYKYTEHEYKKNKNKVKDLYDRLKNMYKDLLTEHDLNSIFNSHSHVDEDLAKADETYKTYKNYWIAILMLFTLIIVILGLILPNIK